MRKVQSTPSLLRKRASKQQRPRKMFADIFSSGAPAGHVPARAAILVDLAHA